MLNRKNFSVTAATYGLLALAGTVSFSLPNSFPTTTAAASPAKTGEQVKVYGVVRDFLKDNTDFKTAPSGGNGHYAGNISLALGADDRPVYSGTGYKVSAQWRDKDSHQIAPHLFLDAYTLQLASAPNQESGTVIDTWDSSLGAYGGSNIGPAPTIKYPSPMPTLSEPTGMGPSPGDMNYTSTPVTLSSNIHCNSFLSKQSTTFNITAPVTILCEANFTPGKLNTFNIQSGGSLTIYVKGLFLVKQTTTMNMNTWKPSLLKVYNLGTTTMEINQSSSFCGQIITPNAPLHLAQADQFYGSFVGKSVDIDQMSGFHLDKSVPQDFCNVNIADTAGTKGATSNGGMVSAANFNIWFNDVMGTNSSVSSSITFTKNSSGIYEFLNDEYHPIDNQAFGNEFETHNNYFTLAVTIPFVHHACQGGFFEFQGCDDAWLFVDKSLGMDLGGMVPNTWQYVGIDRFSLVDGQQYNLHFFYAQRQPNMSTFKMRTNLDIVGESVPVPVTAMYD